jgi:uncharacterized membrane protein
MLVRGAISFLVPCAIIAAVSIPLILELVPPNKLYGFRTSQTLANRELWFRTNRFAGWSFLLAAAVSTAVFIAEPEYASGRSAAGLVIFVAPLAIAVAACFVYLRRIGGGGQR